MPPQVLKEGSRGLSKENWMVYHPDGTPMFTCGEKRANWYLSKTDEKNKPLAKQIDEFEIQLNFKPKGKGFKKNEIFGLVGRKNRCVVSGAKEDLQRHHVVPYCYRKHLPNEYKTKNHHDVVLISYIEHQEYELHATAFKNKLSELYGVPTLNELNSRYTKELSEFSDEKVRILSKVHALYTHYGRIPQETINENLIQFSKLTGISYEDVISKMNYIEMYALYKKAKEYYKNELIEFKNENANKYDHGKQLVKKLKTHEDIEEFIMLWRKHFIDTMKPKYMPEGWSVNFRVKVEI